MKQTITPQLTARLEKARLTVCGGTAQTYNEVFAKTAVIGKLVSREENALKPITSMRSELKSSSAQTFK